MPEIGIIEDNESKTLTVIDVFPQDLNWEDFVIPPGREGTLPSGIISIGDMITNCSEEGVLVWVPCDRVIFTWSFD